MRNTKLKSIPSKFGSDISFLGPALIKKTKFIYTLKTFVMCVLHNIGSSLNVDGKYELDMNLGAYISLTLSEQWIGV